MKIVLTRTNGFTLLEMVIVIVLLTILAGLTAPIFSNGIEVAQTTKQSLQTLAKLRYAVERISREVRQVDYTGAAYNITTMTSASLVFTKDDPNNTMVTITYGGSIITLGYSTPAALGTLTDEVSAMTFTYYDATGAAATGAADIAFVELDLTLQNPDNGGSFSQRTRIALRDKS